MHNKAKIIRNSFNLWYVSVVDLSDRNDVQFGPYKTRNIAREVRKKLSTFLQYADKCVCSTVHPSVYFDTEMEQYFVDFNKR